MALEFKRDHLTLGGVSLKEIAQKAKKTPFYVYDLDEILSRYQALVSAFPNGVEIHYATKANSNSKILKALQKVGSGVDTVSGGEVKECLEVGFKGSEIILSGVAKSVEEIKLAVRSKLKQINVESPQELERIGKIAKKMGKTAQVAFRLNPDVNPETHPYITTGFRENKFGMDVEFIWELKRILKRYKKNIDLKGLSMHIGSQLLDIDVIGEAIEKTIPVYKELQVEGYDLETFDVGGGIGIAYKGEQTPSFEAYGKMVSSLLDPLGCRILLEPGRVLVGPAGVLVSEVQYLKETSHKNFLILNTGMHHLLRPSLYQAYHRILPFKNGKDSSLEKIYDVVGPICESSDVIGKDRSLPTVKQGDLLAIADAGAYGFSMASYYNAHEFPKEYVVSGKKITRA